MIIKQQNIQRTLKMSDQVLLENNRPLAVYIMLPPGCGKSFTAAVLSHILSHLGLKNVELTQDNFVSKAGGKADKGKYLKAIESAGKNHRQIFLLGSVNGTSLAHADISVRLPEDTTNLYFAFDGEFGKIIKRSITGMTERPADHSTVDAKKLASKLPEIAKLHLRNIEDLLPTLPAEKVTRITLDMTRYQVVEVVLRQIFKALGLDFDDTTHIPLIRAMVDAEMRREEERHVKVRDASLSASSDEPASATPASAEISASATPASAEPVPPEPVPIVVKEKKTKPQDVKSSAEKKKQEKPIYTAFFVLLNAMLMEILIGFKKHWDQKGCVVSTIFHATNLFGRAPQFQKHIDWLQQHVGRTFQLRLKDFCGDGKTYGFSAELVGDECLCAAQVDASFPCKCKKLHVTTVLVGDAKAMDCGPMCDSGKYVLVPNVDIIIDAVIGFATPSLPKGPCPPATFE